MVKKITIIIALTLFLKPIFPVLDYVVNYDYISKELCVNKSKPAMHCNGKCHLMKEMAKAAESEKPISSDKKDTSKQEVEVLFFQEIKTLELTQLGFSSSSKINANYSNQYSYLNSCAVFHPPLIIA